MVADREFNLPISPLHLLPYILRQCVITAQCITCNFSSLSMGRWVDRQVIQTVLLAEIMASTCCLRSGEAGPRMCLRRRRGIEVGYRRGCISLNITVFDRTYTVLCAKSPRFSAEISAREDSVCDLPSLLKHQDTHAFACLYLPKCIKR